MPVPARYDHPEATALGTTGAYQGGLLAVSDA
jgi:hypothetical protein